MSAGTGHQRTGQGMVPLNRGNVVGYAHGRRGVCLWCNEAGVVALLDADTLDVVTKPCQELYILEGSAGMLGAGSEVIKQLLAHQETQQREKLYLYRNIRPSRDGGGWEALVRTPHCSTFPVGRHALQVVAACIADDAARAVQRAGVEQDLDLNFDADTREKVLKHVGVTEVPAPDLSKWKPPPPPAPPPQAPPAAAPWWPPLVAAAAAAAPPAAAPPAAAPPALPPAGAAPAPAPRKRRRDAEEEAEQGKDGVGSTQPQVPPSKRPRCVEPTQGGTPAIPAAADEAAGSGPGLPDAETTPAPAAAPAAPPQQPTQPGPEPDTGTASGALTGQQGGAQQAGPLAQDSSRPAQQLSPAELQEYRYQAGQTLLLQGQHKGASSGAFTQTGVQLQLRVEAVRGFGAAGEVYDVKVLQHDFPASTETAGAAAPQSLVGQGLCLKVCRFYRCVPACLRKSMYGDAEAFVFDMHADLFKHHTIMQQLGGGINYILGSHVFGSICGVEGAQVPALLKDRAEMGSVAQQLTQLQQGRRAGLGSRQAHAVVIMAVDGLMDLHDAGWAHLNTMPANIVSSMRSTLTGGNPYIHYSLVGFGSAINVGASRTVQQVVPGTAGYQSPEWRNSNLVGVKADIWAVGVLLLELRAGVALSDDLLQGLMQQSSHASTLAAMRQSATYSHLGEDEWACVTACLTYDHTERPEAAELIKLPYLQL